MGREWGWQVGRCLFHSGQVGPSEVQPLSQVTKLGRGSRQGILGNPWGQ